MTNAELTENQIKGIKMVFTALKKKYPEVLSMVDFKVSDDGNLIFLTLELDIHLALSKYFNEKIGDFWMKYFKGETKSSSSLVSFLEKPTDEDYKKSYKLRETYDNYLDSMYNILPDDYKIFYQSRYIEENRYPASFTVLEFQYVL